MEEILAVSHLPAGVLEVILSQGRKEQMVVGVGQSED